MTYTYFLTILFIQFHLFEVYPLLLQKEITSKQLDLTKFIEFPYQQECLQIVLDPKQQQHQPFLASCDHISIYVRSQISLKFRDIKMEQKGQCETFLIFAESIEMVNKMFNSNQNIAKQFFPFTNIYFDLVNRHNYTTNPESMSTVRKFLIANALFGYVFEYNEDDNKTAMVIRDLLTNDVKRAVGSYIPNELMHPTVDTNLVTENFRISLFNCTPYTIYPQHEIEDEAFINNMDGIEFRAVREVTKNWKKNFKYRDFSRVKGNPYVSILNDLSNKSSDMSMCALWLIEDIYKQYDLSTFYEKQCLTLLVPKPKKLHEATAIYTTLDRHVWLIFFFVFLLSIVLLNKIAKIEKHLNESNSIFIDLSVTVMETINTATSHAVERFPDDQISVKIVLISWILLSSLLGICYTTIYASRLSSPGYEKPINTVRDVVDKGLYVCNAYFDVSTMEPLRNSVNADYRELGKRSIVYADNAQHRRQVLAERKCAIFEVRLTENYVSLLKFKDDLDLLSIYRPMKTCIYNYYTGFAFQKFSPYTKLFNWHIRRYQEHGITEKWHSDILQTSKPMRTLFDDYPDQYKSPNSITLFNVSGAFFLFGTGLFFSLVAFFVEFMKYRREKMYFWKK